MGQPSGGDGKKYARKRRGEKALAHCAPALDMIAYAAETYYITSQEGISIVALAEVAPFNKVTVQTLYHWADAGKWREKRISYFSKIKKQVEDRLANQLIQTRLKQLGMVDIMAEKVLEQLNPAEFGKLIQPSSQEGMIGAFCKLVDLSDKIREKVAEYIVPEQFVESGEIDDSPGRKKIKPQLTEQEARDVAMLLIRQRREQVRAKLAERAEKRKSEAAVEDSESG